MKGYWRKEIRRKLAFIMALVLVWCAVYYEGPIVAEAEEKETYTEFTFEQSNCEISYSEETFTQEVKCDVGGDITYTSSELEVATVDAQTGKVTPQKAGVVTITATRAEDDNYLQTTAEYELTITKGSQGAFAFENAIYEMTLLDDSYTNPLTGILGEGTITYTSDDDEVATVDADGKVTPVGVGETKITATIAEDEKYTSASDSYTLKVVLAPRENFKFDIEEHTIKITEQTYTQTVTGTEGEGEISYTSNNPEVATVNSETGVVTLAGKGEATITATIAEAKPYAGATASYKLIVELLEQENFKFDIEEHTIKITEQTYTQTVTGAEGEGEISYTSNNPEVATVNSETGVVTLVGKGEATITATIAEAKPYAGATASYKLIVEFLKQEAFGFENPEYSQKYSDGAFKIEATGGLGSGAVSYKSSDPAVAEVNETTGEVTPKKAGTTVISATIAEDKPYASATVSYTLTVTLGEQTGFAFNITTYSMKSTDEAHTELASGGQGTGAVKYTSSDSTVAEVNETTGKVTPKKAGTVTITATRDKDEKYAATTTSYALTITLGDQTGFAFDNRTHQIKYSDGEYTKIASGGESTGAISYASSDNTVATVDATTGKVTPVKAGNVTITATRAADEKYAAISTFYTLTITLGDQAAFAFEGQEPGKVSYSSNNRKYQRQAIGGSGTAAVVYSIECETEGTATIDSATGEVTFVKPGRVTVKAIKTGGEQWSTAVATYEMVIMGEQEVSFAGTKQPGTNEQLTNGSDIYYGQSLTIVANGKETNGTPENFAGGDVSYEVASGNFVTVDKKTGVITFTNQKTGGISVKATVTPQAGAYYYGAEGTFNVNVKYLPAPETAYVLEGDKINDKWFVDAVNIKAPEGYQISYSNDLTDNTWADYVTLTDTEVGVVSGKVIYLKKKATGSAEDGAITDAILVEDIYRDTTKPQNLKITYDQTSVKEIVLQALTFGIYKGDVQVTISAEDGESGIAQFKYAYTVSDGVNSINKGAAETTVDLQPGATSYTFTIPAQFRGTLSFTAINGAGHSIQSDESNIIVDDKKPECQVTYTGNYAGMTDASGNAVTVENINTRYVYNGLITAKVVMKEANFDINKESVVITVKRDGAVINQGEGYSFAEADWTYNATDEVYERTILLGKDSNEQFIDGDYDISISYTDIANNSMDTYQSPKYCVQTKTPVMTVAYDNNDALNNTNYRQSRTATITVEGRNVLKKDLKASVVAVNKKNTVAYDLSAKMSDWAVIETVAGCPSKWQATITYDADATYTFSASCENMIGLGASASDSFTVDMNAPDQTKFKVEYSVPLMEKVLSGISFKYYQPKVAVTITVEDIVSGIDTLTWEYVKEAGTSAVNVETVSQTFTREQLNYSEDGTVASATFTLSASEAEQYRGNISIAAVDMAGNSSAKHVEDKTVVVVDDIAPTRTVEYSPAVQVVKKDTLETVSAEILHNENSNLILYYDAPMTMTLRVNEANFYAEDVVVNVNGERTTDVNWSQSGDVWTGTVGLSESGDYVITMTYKDRSNNEMVSYTSEQITIDTTNPVMTVSHSGGTTGSDGKAYSESPVTVTVSVTEHNFRAWDMDATVFAADVSNASIAVADFASHLKNPNSWSTNGDIHTTSYTFASDANYSISVNYKDLACRYIGSSQGTTFTVDQTAPENLKVSYSQSVFDTIMQTITFGFYNAPVTVTLTADDATSGISRFEYNYVKAEGVSAVNAGQTGIVVDESNISYSNGNKTATAVIQIPASELRENNQFNGTISFVAFDRAGRSNSYQDDKRIVVDSLAPITTVEYSEPVRTEDKVSYYAGVIDATVRVNEANFDKEGVIVTVSKDGNAAEAIVVDWMDENVDEHVGTFQLAEDGDYIVQVDYADYAGNQMQTYKSNQLTIDTKKPVIKLEGLKDRSANKDATIGFVLTVEDINLDAASIKPMLKAETVDKAGQFQNEDLTKQGEIKVEESGNKYIYTITNLEADGVYSITCSASDMAANATDSVYLEDSQKDAEVMMFSVNRKGSAYSLVAGEKILGQYIQAGEDIVISEVNATELSDVKVTLYKNDKTIILEEGKDYRLDVVGGNGEWYSYTYTISKDNFQDDGVYRIALYSKDEAGNVAENTLDVKEMELSFAVDKTKPNLVVTNLESGVTYPTENHEVKIQALDNLKLSSIVVKLDGKEYKSWTAEEIAEIEKQNGEYVIPIPGTTTQSHDMEILLYDAANNEYIQTISGFYVTTNKWVQFYNNKLLFFGSIAAGVAAIGGTATAATMTMRRKKRRKK